MESTPQEKGKAKRKKRTGKKIDLKVEINEFIKEQLEYLEIERKEEEETTLQKLTNCSAKELEKLGVCIRKLNIVEITLESYGKYQTEFEKRTQGDMERKINKYKFEPGDVVGLYTYSSNLQEELYRGIVFRFNAKKIIVSFDVHIEESSLPKNICLVQLVNQVTYDRIKSSLEQLSQMEINTDCYSLVNCLFNISQPTLNDSEEKMRQLSTMKYFNSNLNDSQKEAIKFCLQCNEVGLIHGPPGTGKTTTVVELILQLVSMGNKILVVTPSNIAVDNIAEKLLQFSSQLKLELVRHGHPARLLPSVIDSCLDAKIEQSTDMKFIREVKLEIEKNKRELDKTSHKDRERKRRLKDELKDLRKEMKGNYIEKVNSIFQNANVILATCVGSGEKKLQLSLKQPFDYVIIDECAQGTECLCWIPILQGKKLILAGDHLQLPPTIKSKDAEYVLGYTLFDRLMDSYGEEVSRMLTIQYRMHELIMNFSSKELYEGKLCAHESVKNHKLIDLILSNDWTTKDEIGDKDTLGIVDKSLVLLDTSGCQFYETLDLESLSRFNMGEVEICKFLINHLAALCVPLDNVGIITPYSSQVNTLKDHLSSDEYKDLEISTVDGFQGREKEVIILSLVRSNKSSEVGFLAEKRRLNVAITRPRRLLVVIGDTGTIESDPFLKKLSEYLNSHATVIDIVGNVMDHEKYKEVQDMCVEEKQKESKEANSKKGKGGYEEEQEPKRSKDNYNSNNKGKYDEKKSNNKKQSNTKNKQKRKK